MNFSKRSNSCCVDALLEQVRCNLNALRMSYQVAIAPTVLLALSGGRDSMVLLDVLLQIEKLGLIRLLVLHVDHRLREESTLQAKQLQEHCASLGVCCHVHVLQPNITLTQCVQGEGRDGSKQSVEAWARSERYSALTDFATLHDVQIVATAHHREDHRENFWMRLLEGKQFEQCALFCTNGRVGSAILWRPLLSVCGDTLCAYSKRQNIVIYEDASNYELTFRRNLLRHKILPTLSSQWPLNLDKITDSLIDNSRETEQVLLKRTLKLGNSLRCWWGGLLLYPFTDLLPLEWLFVLRYAKDQWGFPGMRRSVMEEFMRQRQARATWCSVKDEGGGTWYGFRTDVSPTTDLRGASLGAADAIETVWDGQARPDLQPAVMGQAGKTQIESIYYLSLACKNLQDRRGGWSVGTVHLVEGDSLVRVVLHNTVYPLLQENELQAKRNALSTYLEGFVSLKCRDKRKKIVLDFLMGEMTFVFAFSLLKGELTSQAGAYAELIRNTKDLERSAHEPLRVLVQKKCKVRLMGDLSKQLRATASIPKNYILPAPGLSNKEINLALTEAKIPPVLRKKIPLIEITHLS
mgnify:CR=1 FL=1